MKIRPFSKEEDKQPEMMADKLGHIHESQIPQVAKLLSLNIPH